MGGSHGKFTSAGIGGKAKQRLWERDGGRCHLCGEIVATMSDATRDHIIPLSKGGCTCSGNIALAHRWCNNRRGNTPSTSVTRKKRTGHLLADHE